MADVTTPGRLLHARFNALGNMSGMTAKDIAAFVGRPTSISSLPNGGQLIQWQATGCHMALRFGPDGRMIEITHEYANYSTAPEGGCMAVIVFLLGIAFVIGMLVLAGH